MDQQDRVETLRRLYREIAAHTKTECDGENEGCRLPRSCCDRMYCDMAAQVAKEQYGIELTPVGHDPNLPFMGPEGCTVEPYLRPLCSLHVCCINGLGAKTRGQGASEWTRRYFELCEQIETIEQGD